MEKKHILRGHSEGVLALRFTPDSFSLASGGDDGTVRMWDVASGNLRSIFTGEWCAHRSVRHRACMHVRFHSHTGKGIQMRQMCGLRLLPWSQLPAHALWPSCRWSSVSHSPPQLHHADNAGAPLMLPAGHNGRVHGLAFIGSGTILFSASKDKTVMQWDLLRAAHRKTMEGEGAPCARPACGHCSPPC